MCYLFHYSITLKMENYTPDEDTGIFREGGVEWIDRGAQDGGGEQQDCQGGLLAELPAPAEDSNDHALMTSSTR